MNSHARVKLLKSFNNTNNSKRNETLSNHFLSNLLKYTLPHLIIKQEENTHLIVDKLEGRVHYAQLHYNLHLNENVIKENNLFLIKKQLLLEKQFNKYDVNCYKIGTGFYSKIDIPMNIKTLHRERYETLIGVNEYLTNVGCCINFKDNRDYKNCFKNIDFSRVLK